MSDKPKTDKPAPEAPRPAEPNRAQAEFDRYRQRLGGGQPAMMLPWAVPAGMMPGWAMPPSMGAMPGGGAHGPAPPGWGAQAAPTIERAAGGLAETLRLGVELVNAALGAGTRALAGGSGMLGAWAQPAGGCSCGGQGGGCGCQSGCGCASCCGTMGCDPCCSPGVRNCC